jgi:DNA-binding PadR family transcriptional regulator
MRVIKMKGGEMPLERGDLRLLVLNMLKEPMHGYQIMCRMKEQSGGEYKPSTGALYPQLHGLEEEGLVICEEKNGKKVYTVTKKGENYLTANKDLVKESMRRFSEFWTTNDLDVLVESMQRIAHTLMRGAGDVLEGNDNAGLKKLEESKKALAEFEKELNSIWQ